MDLTQAIGEAYDAAIESDDGTAAGEPAPAPAAPAEPPAAPDGGEAEAAEAGTTAPARDAAGKFAPATKAKDKPAAPAKAAEAKPAPKAETKAPAKGEAGAPSTAPAAPKHKAPQSWRPAVRERWGELPDWAQEEITKRERDATTAMTRAIANQKRVQELDEVLRPYEPMLKELGAAPMPAVANMLQTAAMLRGPNAAQAVAHIIKGYKVDLEAINDALGLGAAGGKAEAPPADPRLDAAMRELAELRQHVAGRHQAEEQRERSSASKAVEEFGRDREFFEDLREPMSVLLQHGLAHDLESAYDQAAYANPEIRAIMEQRKAAELAKANQEATKRARAGTGIRTQPQVAQGAGGGTNRRVEDTILALWNE